MSIDKEFLCEECGLDYDEHTSGPGLNEITKEDFLFNKKNVFAEIENTINENKDSFYGVVLDIKSGHFDFPPECILVQLDLLLEEMKEKLEKYFEE